MSFAKASSLKRWQAIILTLDFLFKYSIETVGASAISYGIPPGQEFVDFGS